MTPEAKQKLIQRLEQGRHRLFVMPVRPPIQDIGATIVAEPVRGVDRVRTVSDYWGGIRRHKLIVCVLGLVSALAALAWSLTQKPMFRATASVEVQVVNEEFLNMKNVDPITSNLSLEAYLQTQVELLGTDAVFARVAHSFSPQGTGGSTRGPKKDGVLQRLRQALLMKPTQVSSPEEEALESIRDSVKIKPVSATHIIHIIAEQSDGVRAAELANSVATEFINYSVESRWNANQKTNEWLNRQVSAVKAKLEGSERELQNYTRGSGLVFEGQENSVARARLKALQEELSRAEADRVAKQSQYEMAISAQADSLPAVLDNATLGDYQVKLAEMRRQLAEFNEAYTPAHYKVKRLEQQIAELQNAFEKKRGDIVRRIGNEHEASRRREAMLRNAFAAQASVVSDQAAKEIRYNILKREVDSNRLLYDALLQRLRESNVATAYYASNIRLIDPARPAPYPFKPNPPLNVLLAALGGMFAAACFLVVREATDKSIRTPGEARAFTRVPELGVIPYHAGPARGRSGVTGAVGVHDSLRSALASVITKEWQAGRRTLIVTSPGPWEGKTTVACGLATVLARMGQRVILVDGDARRPKLHKIFGTSRQSGLGELLREDGAIDRMRRSDLGCPTATDGLVVLPAGEDLESVGDVVYASRMPALLTRLEREFDFVIVDTPPVLCLPTARITGRTGAAVLLVLRYGRTTPDAALTAASHLREGGCRILGTVLNCWDPRVSYYGYDAIYGSTTKGSRPA